MSEKIARKERRNNFPSNQLTKTASWLATSNPTVIDNPKKKQFDEALIAVGELGL